MCRFFNTTFFLMLATVVMISSPSGAQTPARMPDADIQYPAKERAEKWQEMLRGKTETPPAVPEKPQEQAPASNVVVKDGKAVDPKAAAPATEEKEPEEPKAEEKPQEEKAVPAEPAEPAQSAPASEPARTEAPAPPASPEDVHKVKRIGEMPAGMLPDDVDYLSILESSLLKQPVQAPWKMPFTDGEGKEVILKEFKGKVVLLNFWATWCTPCTLEMPHLDALHEEFNDQELPIKVVAVSEDFKGAEVIKKFYAENGIEHLDIYVDPKNALFREFGIVSLPTTILIDQYGQKVMQISGYVDWTKPDVKAFVKSFVTE